MKDDYLLSLKNEIDFQKEKFWLWKEKIYTIYFGWWTPSEFWLERTFELLNYVKEKFDTSFLQEFSFELNPILGNDIEWWKVNYTLLFMERLNNFVLENFWIPARFSIWIQSLDDNLLEKSWRNYTFKQIEELLGRMRDNIFWCWKNNIITDNWDKITDNSQALLGTAKGSNPLWLEQDNLWLYNKNQSPKSPLVLTSPIINLDFISFGIENDLDKNYFQKFHNFVEKYFDVVDSYSIYTLELFDGSIWKNIYQTNEDKILDNFQSYLNVLKKFKYERYEISNFAKKWKESKHNQVYWEMKPYLWFGTSASWLVKLANLSNLTDWEKINNGHSCENRNLPNTMEENRKFPGQARDDIQLDSKSSALNSQFSYIRYTNSYWIQNYLKWCYDYSEYKKLSEKEFLQEKVFLSLRTNKWLKLSDDVKSLLDMRKVNDFVQDKYLKIKDDILYMTDKGFSLYNYILTDILDI